jgi:hypothetical protein
MFNLVNVFITNIILPRGSNKYQGISVAFCNPNSEKVTLLSSKIKQLPKKLQSMIDPDKNVHT